MRKRLCDPCDKGVGAVVGSLLSLEVESSWPPAAQDATTLGREEKSLRYGVLAEPCKSL